MRSVVLVAAILFTILSSTHPSGSARAGEVEDFARAWLRDETFDLENYHNDYRGTEINDGVLSVVRKPELRSLYEEARHQGKHVRLLSFTLVEKETTGDRIKVAFWHRQITIRGKLKTETQSQTTGTLVRGGPAGLQWLTTDTVDYFIRHLP